MTDSTTPMRSNNMIKTASKSKRCIWLYMVLMLLTAARLVLAWCTPVGVDLSPSSTFDDSLLIKLGMSINSGNWLGQYDKLTLAKNPGYPIFLAFCAKTGIRYQLALCLLLVLACMAFSIALRPLIKNRFARATLYVVLLYMPLCFTTAWFRRIYRDGLVIPFSIAAFAGFLGLYLRRKERTEKLVPWAFIASLSFACLQIIKENGAWILPFSAVCCIVMFIGWLWNLKQKKTSAVSVAVRSILLIAPFLCGFLITQAIGRVNASYYGAPLLSERFSGSFARVSSDMAQIGERCDHTALWISRKALNDAFRSSPTLRQCKPEIEDSWKTWSLLFDNKDVYGDMAYWALRDGVYASKQFRNAADAEKYWSSVANEIETGFNDGTLQKQNGLHVSSVSPVVQSDSFGKWIGLTFWTSGKLATLSHMNGRLIGSTRESIGLPKDYSSEMSCVRKFLGNNAVPYDCSSDGSVIHKAANRVDHILGKLGVLLFRISLIASVPLFLWLLVSRTSLPDKTQKIELALIVMGLILSSLAFEAATCWYVQYQLGIFTVDSYLLEVYKYSPEFYVCLILATGFVISAALSSILKLRNKTNSKCHQQSRKNEQDLKL